MLFELFDGGVHSDGPSTRPRARAPTPASPPLRAPTLTTPPAPVPAPRAMVPHTTVSAAPTPAPANTSRCSAFDACGRCGEDLTDAACTGRERRATSSTSCSRSVVRAPLRCANQAVCALPHRDARTLPPRDARTPSSTAPASRPTSCTLLIAQMLSLKRFVAESFGCTPVIGRTLLRGHPPWLPRPAPSRARRVGEPRHRDACSIRLTGDARRRDLVARGPEKLRIPEQSDHRIRSKVISHSGGKVITDSGAK